MNSRTGVDAVTFALLETLEEMGATHKRPYQKSAGVLEHLDATRGIAPRYGYDAMVTAYAHWLTHVHLVDFHGNYGSADPNDRPANPRYTECRLSRAGAMALASERGELPRLPISLINGDLAAGGFAPPFDPHRVAEAVLATGSGVDDAALVALAGRPEMPTACAVDVDLAALAAGEPTTLRSSARIDVERSPGGDVIVLSSLPFGVSGEEVGMVIAQRVDAARHNRGIGAELRARLDLPVRDVRNESTEPTTRVVCELSAGADVDDCRARLLEIWPISTERTVRLRVPLAPLVRSFADDPVAQAPALTELLASGPLRR